MKRLKLIALAAFALLFSQCKTTGPTAPSGPAPSLLEVHSILDSAQSRFLQFADQTGGDPAKAIELTTSWLSTQSNVQSAESTDSTYITITLKSGLQTTFYFEQIDANGYDVFRGGGGATVKGTPDLISDHHSSKLISNKKVLLYIADTKTITAEFHVPEIRGYFANSGLGFEVTLLRDTECTDEIIKTFGDYGLVIIDTHGLPDAFLIGSKVNFTTLPKTEDEVKTTINSAMGPGASDKFTTKKLIMAASVHANPKIPNWQKKVAPTHERSVFYSSENITVLPDMPGTIIFGNMCYSGYTEKIRVTGKPKVMNTPIGLAFKSKNLISYYGYALQNGSSLQVSDPFAVQMEDSMVRRFVINLDSTGITNLKADNSTEYSDPFWAPRNQSLRLKHFNADNYSYDSCIDHFTDVRDGHIYKAVCIGKQVWMAENLNYDAPGSKCYDDAGINCITYGKLYDWNTVMQGASSSESVPSNVQGVCPKGWHLPSISEFQNLITFLGDGDKASGALKSVSSAWESPNLGATNSTGFSALPAGEGYPFSSFGKVGRFWSASEWSSNLNFGMTLYLTNNNEGGPIDANPKAHFASCRCLKD